MLCYLFVLRRDQFFLYTLIQERRKLTDYNENLLLIDQTYDNRRQRATCAECYLCNAAATFNIKSTSRRGVVACSWNVYLKYEAHRDANPGRQILAVHVRFWYRISYLIHVSQKPLHKLTY